MSDRGISDPPCLLRTTRRQIELDSVAGHKQIIGRKSRYDTSSKQILDAEFQSHA